MSDSQQYQTLSEKLRFYKSSEWQRKRQEILERDNYECQHCKKRGQFSRARSVHHIRHLERWPELALDDDNLISLCEPCHNEQHPEKGMSEKRTLLNEERWE